MEEQNNNHLRRSMTTGQMEMIAIGGTIGSGLFMGPPQPLNGPVHPSVGLCRSWSGFICHDAGLGGNESI